MRDGGSDERSEASECSRGSAAPRMPMGSGGAQPPATSMSEAKRANRGALRQHLRATRRGLSAVEQRRAARSIAPRVWDLVADRSGVVAGYVADDGEVDLAPTIAGLRRRGGAIALPAFDTPDAPMRFAFHRGDGELVSGPLGIWQPPPSARTVHPQDLSVVLLPAVAVDRYGTRLGRGAGHYDRLFAERADWPRRPRLIAVIHDEQISGDLDREVWDVPVDAVLTPTRLVLPLVEPNQ